MVVFLNQYSVRITLQGTNTSPRPMIILYSRFQVSKKPQQCFLHSSCSARRLDSQAKPHATYRSCTFLSINAALRPLKLKSRPLVIPSFQKAPNVIVLSFCSARHLDSRAKRRATCRTAPRPPSSRRSNAAPRSDKSASRTTRESSGRFTRRGARVDVFGCRFSCVMP